MKTFDSVDRSAFRWLRQAGSPTAYQLLAGDDEVANLRWAGAHGSLAYAQTAGAPVALKREGFLSPHVLLRDAEGRVMARLDLHFSASRLTVGSEEYVLRRKGFLLPAWQVATSAGQPLLHIETVAEHGLLQGGVVAVEPAGQKIPSLPLLLLVAWYFIVQAWFEEEAAHLSAAAVVATG